MTLARKFHVNSAAALFLKRGFLILTVFMVVGCADQHAPTKKPEQTPSRFGYGGTNVDDAFVTTDQTTTNSITNSEVASMNAPTSTPPTNPFMAPTPQPTVVTHDLPYGTPVPGKPGFVTSPHSPNAGYVDVRGFPPGTEVKDPYSGKIFLVP